VINPWNWQEDQGWTWGIEVTAPFRILHTAGQVPVGADGRLLHPGDVRGQTAAALDNLETVLTTAGHALADVVRVDFYTTRPDELTDNWDVVASRLLPAGCRAGGVLLGVDRLATPELLVQIQAISIRAAATAGTRGGRVAQRGPARPPNRAQGLRKARRPLPKELIVMPISANEPSVAERAARIGLWALPLYAVLLGLSTLTHQPPVSDFDAYARYVTTNVFLISHLGASIFGAATAILGVTAVTAYLVRGRAAGTALVGLVLTTVTNVFMAAAFGSAAFVQPGIGRAHLAGVPGMQALNADTAYGPAFFATALTSTFFLIVSAAVLGTAIARTHRRLRPDGIVYPALVAAFTLSGFVFQPVQAFAGFALAAATAALAVRLPRLAVTAATSPAGTPSASIDLELRP